MITPEQLDKQHAECETSSNAEDEPAPDTDEMDTAALEARIDELEAGMKAVASSVEDTVDHIEALSDRLDDVDAVPDGDEESNASDQPITEPTERMFQ